MEHCGIKRSRVNYKSGDDAYTTIVPVSDAAGLARTLKRRKSDSVDTAYNGRKRNFAFSSGGTTLEMKTAHTKSKDGMQGIKRCGKIDGEQKVIDPYISKLND